MTPPWSPNLSFSSSPRPRRPSKLSIELNPESLEEDTVKTPIKTPQKTPAGKYPVKNTFVKSPVKMSPNSRDTVSSVGDEVLDPLTEPMTVNDAMELIYGEVRAAAIEDDLYDPENLVASIETINLSDKVQIDSSNQNTSPLETTLAGEIETAAASKPAGLAPRLTRELLRARAASFFTEILPSLARRTAPSKDALPGPNSPLPENLIGGVDGDHPLLGASVRAGQSVSNSPVDSEFGKVHRPEPLRSAAPLTPDSLRVNSFRADDSTVFEPFRSDSHREALLSANPKLSAKATSVVSTAGSIRPGSTRPLSPNASAANALAEAKSQLLSSVALLGGPSKIRARNALEIAARGFFDNDISLHPYQFRYADFANEFGWMLLCVCVHSETFNELVEGDEASWKAVCEKIREEAVSLELYAAYARLDWYLPLPPRAYPELRDKIHYLKLDTRKAISLSNEIFTPEYNGVRQVDIEESFYQDVFWPRLKPQTDRCPEKDGECALCGSSSLCDCEPPNDFRALVEIREYPDGRGIGVRSLGYIKAGAFFGTYMGEMRTAPLIDTTYVIEQIAPGENDTTSVCLLDASEHGNWTRYANHSCRPSAVFASVAIGKKRYAVLRATKDIGIFDEITVDYGDSYFGPSDRECKCGEKECRYRGEGGGEPRPNGGKKGGAQGGNKGKRGKKGKGRKGKGKAW
ncbi:hypothetical protein VTO42DRAFT_8046 [Malbranchea cinnamomea]